MEKYIGTVTKMNRMYISDLDESGNAKIFRCKMCGVKCGGLVMKRHLRLCGKKRVYPDDR